MSYNHRDPVDGRGQSLPDADWPIATERTMPHAAKSLFARAIGGAVRINNSGQFATNHTHVRAVPGDTPTAPDCLWKGGDVLMRLVV